MSGPWQQFTTPVKNKKGEVEYYIPPDIDEKKKTIPLGTKAVKPKWWEDLWGGITDAVSGGPTAEEIDKQINTWSEIGKQRYGTSPTGLEKAPSMEALKQALESGSARAVKNQNGGWDVYTAKDDGDYHPVPTYYVGADGQVHPIVYQDNSVGRGGFGIYNITNPTMGILNQIRGQNTVPPDSVPGLMKNPKTLWKKIYKGAGQDFTQDWANDIYDIGHGITNWLGITNSPVPVRRNALDISNQLNNPEQGTFSPYEIARTANGLIDFGTQALLGGVPALGARSMIKSTADVGRGETKPLQAVGNTMLDMALFRALPGISNTAKKTALNIFKRTATKNPLINKALRGIIYATVDQGLSVPAITAVNFGQGVINSVVDERELPDIAETVKGSLRLALVGGILSARNAPKNNAAAIEYMSKNINANPDKLIAKVSDQTGMSKDEASALYNELRAINDLVSNIVGTDVKTNIDVKEDGSLGINVKTPINMPRYGAAQMAELAAALTRELTPAELRELESEGFLKTSEAKINETETVPIITEMNVGAIADYLNKKLDIPITPETAPVELAQGFVTAIRGLGENTSDNASQAIEGAAKEIDKNIGDITPSGKKYNKDAKMRLGRSLLYSLQSQFGKDGGAAKFKEVFGLQDEGPLLQEFAENYKGSGADAIKAVSAENTGAAVINEKGQASIIYRESNKIKSVKVDAKNIGNAVRLLNLTLVPKSYFIASNKKILPSGPMSLLLNGADAIVPQGVEGTNMALGTPMVMVRDVDGAVKILPTGKIPEGVKRVSPQSLDKAGQEEYKKAMIDMPDLIIDDVNLKDAKSIKPLGESFLDEGGKTYSVEMPDGEHTINVPKQQVDLVNAYANAKLGPFDSPLSEKPAIKEPEPQKTEALFTETPEELKRRISPLKGSAFEKAMIDAVDKYGSNEKYKSTLNELVKAKEPAKKQTVAEMIEEENPHLKVVKKKTVKKVIKEKAEENKGPKKDVVVKKKKAVKKKEQTNEESNLLKEFEDKTEEKQATRILNAWNAYEKALKESKVKRVGPAGFKTDDVKLMNKLSALQENYLDAVDDAKENVIKKIKPYLPFIMAAYIASKIWKDDGILAAALLFALPFGRFGAGKRWSNKYDAKDSPYYEKEVARLKSIKANNPEQEAIENINRAREIIQNSKVGTALPGTGLQDIESKRYDTDTYKKHIEMMNSDNPIPYILELDKDLNFYFSIFPSYHIGLGDGAPLMKKVEMAENKYAKFIERHKVGNELAAFNEWLSTQLARIKANTGYTEAEKKAMAATLKNNIGPEIAKFNPSIPVDKFKEGLKLMQEVNAETARYDLWGQVKRMTGVWGDEFWKLVRTAEEELKLIAQLDKEIASLKEKLQSAPSEEAKAIYKTYLSGVKGQKTELATAAKRAASIVGMSERIKAELENIDIYNYRKHTSSYGGVPQYKTGTGVKIIEQAGEREKISAKIRSLQRRLSETKDKRKKRRIQKQIDDLRKQQEQAKEDKENDLRPSSDMKTVAIYHRTKTPQDAKKIVDDFAGTIGGKVTKSNIPDVKENLFNKIHKAFGGNTLEPAVISGIIEKGTDVYRFSIHTLPQIAPASLDMLSNLINKLIIEASKHGGNFKLNKVLEDKLEEINKNIKTNDLLGEDSDVMQDTMNAYNELTELLKNPGNDFVFRLKSIQETLNYSTSIFKTQEGYDNWDTYLTGQKIANGYGDIKKVNEENWSNNQMTAQRMAENNFGKGGIKEAIQKTLDLFTKLDLQSLPLPRFLQERLEMLNQTTKNLGQEMGISGLEKAGDFVAKWYTWLMFGGISVSSFVNNFLGSTMEKGLLPRNGLTSAAASLIKSHWQSLRQTLTQMEKGVAKGGLAKKLQTGEYVQNLTDKFYKIMPEGAQREAFKTVIEDRKLTGDSVVHWLSPTLRDNPLFLTLKIVEEINRRTTALNAIGYWAKRMPEGLSNAEQAKYLADMATIEIGLVDKWFMDVMAPRFGNFIDIAKIRQKKPFNLALMTMQPVIGMFARYASALKGIKKTSNLRRIVMAGLVGGLLAGERSTPAGPLLDIADKILTWANDNPDADEYATRRFIRKSMEDMFGKTAGDRLYRLIETGLAGEMFDSYVSLEINPVDAMGLTAVQRTRQNLLALKNAWQQIKEGKTGQGIGGAVYNLSIPTGVDRIFKGGVALSTGKEFAGTPFDLLDTYMYGDVIENPDDILSIITMGHPREEILRIKGEIFDSEKGRREAIQKFFGHDGLKYTIAKQDLIKYLVNPRNKKYDNMRTMVKLKKELPEKIEMIYDTAQKIYSNKYETWAEKAIEKFEKLAEDPLIAAAIKDKVITSANKSPTAKSAIKKAMNWRRGVKRAIKKFFMGYAYADAINQAKLSIKVKGINEYSVDANIAGYKYKGDISKVKDPVQRVLYYILGKISEGAKSRKTVAPEYYITLPGG